MDIELPDKLGLEIAKLLKETYRNIIIAFVTSFDNYVYDAFDYDVIAYIRKQEFEIRLSSVIDRVIKKYKEMFNKSYSKCRRTAYCSNAGHRLFRVLRSQYNYI